MLAIGDLLRQFFQLWRFGWPMLLCIAACGALVNDLLLPLAVKAGFTNALAGFAVLSAIVLAKLVTVVAMCLSLRPAMPGVTALFPAKSIAGAAEGTPKDPDWLSVVAIAIIPFFAYYAAWGFLGDTVRDYSLLALEMADFGQKLSLFDVPATLWLGIAVAFAFGMRRLAKLMQTRSSRPAWQFVIVLCDANWIFVGLYALTGWKNAAWAWVGAGGPLPYLIRLRDLFLGLIGQAQAATPVAVDLAAPSLQSSAQGLFLYALLPLVWLLMAAVIYGFDMKDAAALASHRRTAAALSRYERLPKFLREFIEHFVAGYRSRYLPIANSVRLAFGAGLAVLIGFVLVYRLIGWAAAWGWIGLAHLIGPQELPAWQALASIIAFFLGGPSDIRGGILVDALRICLVAAVVEQASAKRVEALSSSGRSEDSAVATPAG
ncbi:MULTISPECIES: hypothetical protein [Bosea]|uniref:hypothetical protein n=1 Tax=Bosea TaxID=85413 RepID=UPI002150429E|nr:MULTISPECIES: hypothetical protein [Bosea]MCR4519866.1 hypothetical protein [Bosea sp. 47.2.35]MDR6828888.1 hypothetical protein [Bosea robiniae]MDR6895698.1 hypothetical protein [Bosea sp. BE109]MDR7139094.1 hypothetical protein [Bosea sp. BE168]MDR7175868.1 hypothetical protein [Bosea sp. BE271]